MPDGTAININDTSVDAITVKSGKKVYWHNATSSSVCLSNLPDILSPTPNGAEFTLGAGENSRSYTVNGSKGSYSYNLSLVSPDELPTTGTISID